MSSTSTEGTEGSSTVSNPGQRVEIKKLEFGCPHVGVPVPNRIFVGGMSASTSKAELAQVFSAYGNVTATNILYSNTGVSRGYGFVTFETAEEARSLYEKFRMKSECIIIKEQEVYIAPAIQKRPINRSKSPRIYYYRKGNKFFLVS